MQCEIVVRVWVYLGAGCHSLDELVLDTRKSNRCAVMTLTFLSLIKTNNDDSCVSKSSSLLGSSKASCVGVVNVAALEVKEFGCHVRAQEEARHAWV